MKKVILVALIAIVGMGVFLNSCNKEDSISSENQVVKQTKEDLAFQNRLVQFRDKVQFVRDNPNIKDGEMLSVDEAVLNLETLFNSTYSFSQEKYRSTKADETTILIPISDGNISMNDVVASFDEIHALVLQYYQDCSFENKEFYLLDLEKVNIINGTVEVKLRSVVGDKEDPWQYFGSEDYWFYGYNLGGCEDNPATESAADVKLQEAIMNSQIIISPPAGYSWEYEDQQEYELFGDEYSNTQGVTYIYCIEDIDNNGFTDDEQCLTPTEMNFNFNGEREVIYNLRPNDPIDPFESNRVFRGCTITGVEESYPYDINRWFVHHQSNLTYALRYLVEDIGSPIKL